MSSGSVARSEKPSSVVPKVSGHGYAYFRCLASKNFLEGLVVVAVQPHARLDAVRHFEGIEAVADGAVYAETLQLMLRIDEAQTVAVGESRCSGNVERVVAYLLDMSHELSQCLWRVG